MEMRTARMMGMCGMLVLGALGCGKVSKDNSPVVASVGGEKITETAFAATVNAYLGDAAKAKRQLGWQPRTTFKDLVKLMVTADIELLKAHREGRIKVTT